MTITFIDRLAWHCHDCGGTVHVVTDTQGPICANCHEPRGPIIEHLDSRIDGRFRKWTKYQPPDPDEPIPDRIVYVSRCGDLFTPSNPDQFGDPLEAHGTVYRRLNRDVFRWLGKHWLSERDEILISADRLEHIARLGVETKSLDDWAMHLDRWQLDRAPDANPFEEKGTYHETR